MSDTSLISPSNARFLNNRLIVALDVDEEKECLKVAELLADLVGALKLGPRLVMRYGGKLIKELAHMAPVFVDMKYYDIPSTMAAAIQATFECGASIATVHASAGPVALKQLAQIEQELNQKRPFFIAAVTVLTSFDRTTFPFIKADEELIDQVHRLAALSYNNGLRAMVCSPHEANILRASYPDAFLITPGVRFATDGNYDQKRVTSPDEAVKNGASAVVVGRPIIADPDPRSAAKKYLAALY